MTINTICILIAIVAYLIFMLLIGIKYAKENEDSSDFYLGGRSLGPYVTAMSAEASDMSSYLLMGLPGLAYISGLAEVGWTAIGLAVGTYLNWLLVAKPLRKYTQRIGSYTIPGFFSDRYGDKKRVLSTVAAIFIVIFFIPYTASGFAACGKLFATIFGFNYVVAMIFSAFIVVGYTVAGGFLAASITDFFQSIIMTIALLIVICFATASAGGIGNVLENGRALAGYFSLVSTHNAATGASGTYSLLSICSTLAWGLGYFGMPHILLRFMAINDEEKLKVSRRVGSAWVVIAMFFAILIGIVGRALSDAGVLEMLAGSGSETIIIKISQLLSLHGVIPALVAGIILSGILASTMSTSDSQLLAAASSISENILSEAMHLKLSTKSTMFAARVTVLAISALGIVLALDPDASVFKIVAFAWAGFGASFGPVVLFSLFWRRTTKEGALAGMVSGGAMVFIWKFLVAPHGGVLAIYELLPAFLTACVLLVVVSLLTKEPDKEVLDTFDAVRAK